MILQLILVFILALVLVGVLFFRRSEDPSRPAAPRLNISPVIPDIVSLYKDPKGAFQQAQNNGVGAFRVTMSPTREWHFIYDRQYFKSYFAAGEDVLNFDDSATTFFSHVFGDVYHTGEPAWMENYKKVLTSGLWRSNQLDSFEAKMLNAIEINFEKRWSVHAASGDWFDLGHEIHRMTSLLNLRALLGQTALEAYGDQWQVLMPEMDALATNQVVMNAPTLPFGPSKRFQTVRSEILKMLEEAWISVCEDAREKAAQGETARGASFDSYAELVASGWEGKVSNHTIMMHILSIMFAAHINTANALIWSISNISRRPDYIQRVIDDNASGDVSFCGFALKESARLYPVLGTFRMMTRDGCIEGTNFWAKKGDIVSCSPLVSHYDPELFPDPHTYKPERFEDEQRLKSAGLGYLAFGAGSHRCLGEKYVSRLARKCLQSVFSRYEIEMKNAELPKPVWSTMSEPSPSEPIIIRIKPRA